MLKIVTLSCIIVASLNFQKVNGFNLFPPISRIIKKAPLINTSTEESNNNENLINNPLKFGDENVLKENLNEFQNATVLCTKVYNEIRENVTQLSSALSSCLKKKNETVIENIKKLTNLASDVQKNLGKDVYDMFQCFKNPAPRIVSCLQMINKNLPEPDINELAKVGISEVFTNYPFNLVSQSGSLANIMQCYENLFHQIDLQHFLELFGDAQRCIQSIMQTVISIINQII